MLSPWLDMVAPSTCLTFQIMVLEAWLSLIHWHMYLSLQMFVLLCDHNSGRGENVCIRVTSVNAHLHIHRTIITLPFSLLWEIWIFLMRWEVTVSECSLNTQSGRTDLAHTVWFFGKSLQSQVPCLTWDIIMKWVMLERRSDPFRNLLPVSEIFISVSFDKNSRKKEGR